MGARDLAGLLMLGALWGVAFLFIRVAAPEFGAVALIEVRVVLAALILVPLVVARRQLGEIRAHWRPIILMGVLHYAIPFTLFAWSMLTLTGGYSALINASSPIFAAIVAWLWLGERLQGGRIAGLVVGILGVTVLVWDKMTIGDGSAGLAAGAALLGSACYGVAAVLARKKLAGVSPAAVSAGSMVAAAVVLLPFAIWLGPDIAPSRSAWSMAAALGTACTALAFVLYFRLIANIGPTRAITVTFLVPAFAVAFGSLFIDEAISTSMLLGGLIILLGTGMATGLIDVFALLRRKHAAAVHVAVTGLLIMGLNDTPPDAHVGASVVQVPARPVSLLAMTQERWSHDICVRGAHWAGVYRGAICRGVGPRKRDDPVGSGGTRHPASSQDRR